MRIFLSLYLLSIINYIYSYLSPTEYRDYLIIQDDFSSVQFFSYFQLDLKFFDTNPNLYIKSCAEGSFFGFFKRGNISNYFDYDNYGSISINFNLLVLKEYNFAMALDSIDFYLNSLKVSSLRVDNFTANLNMNPPANYTMCGRDMWMFNISMIYTNNKTSQYPPINFMVSSNLNEDSNVNWAITNMQLIKINCPAKCSICNALQCTGCSDPKTVYKPYSCSCDSAQSLYDFADLNSPPNCQNEEYSNPFENRNWFWNSYSVSPFYFKQQCPDTATSFFGGYKTFGDSDILSKLIKLNDNTIVNSYQPAGKIYYTIPIGNYKIEFSLISMNWDADSQEVIVQPMSLSPALNLQRVSPGIYSCDSTLNLNYKQDYFSYDGLSDVDPRYVNITLVAPALPSRSGNNFALAYFKFSVLPCYRTCLTCASPTLNSCQTCVDVNAILLNGQCVCGPGFDRDIFNPNYPCVSIVTKNIVAGGVVSMNDLGYGAILTNNIRSTSRYCFNTRSIVGGYVTSTLLPNSIDIVTSDIGIIFYMKMITMELITEEDGALFYPFTINYNRNYNITNFTFKQIKYLQFTDAASILSGISCYDPNIVANGRYKLYNLVFYITDNNLITDLSIINSFNLFWGVLTHTVEYFGCHANCNACTGYGLSSCTICKPGMVLNPNNFNGTTSSCICDVTNGYFQIGNNYDPLTCAIGSSGSFNQYYILDLDKEIFNPTIWKNFYSQMSPSDIQVCEDVKILGKYNPMSQNYLEKTFNLTNQIANFDYFSLDVSFNIWFFKSLPSYVIKVFFDGQYIWGDMFSNIIATAAVGSANDDILICDTGQTIFYRKNVSFTYYNNNYFGNLVNNDNPSLRIQVFPDSTCQYNSDCGWGINNFQLRVGKAVANVNSTCSYNRPLSTCPCYDLTQSCKCFPGYFGVKGTNGEYSCVQCYPNCYDCEMVTKCKMCLPGYTVVNFQCVPANQGLVQTQNIVLQFDLKRYYKNLEFQYTGYSINLWAKQSGLELSLDKPILLMDPFLISYNYTAVAYNLKFTNYNYLFSYSQYFTTIMTIPMDPTTFLFHESSWVPFSFAAGFNNVTQSYILQLCINNGNTTTVAFNLTNLPNQILLFNYFSQINYRYLKLWDRYIPINQLNTANYITNYAKTPSDLLVFYKFVEGNFINRGSSNLMYTLNAGKFKWDYDITTPPTSCNENQYYDSVAMTCSYCDTKCTHCSGPGANFCIECNQPRSFVDNTNTCTQVCPTGLASNFKYATYKTCDLSCPPECNTCDNLNGCITCNPGYLLYNNTCVKYCTPQIALSLPTLCLQLSHTCTQSIGIANKPSFFLMDGSNLKLSVNVTDCGYPTHVTWQSTFNNKFITLGNAGKTLYIDSYFMTIPETQTFTAQLWDNTLVHLIGSDFVTIDFVNITMNGGHVMGFYSDDVVALNVNYLNTYINKIYTAPSIQYTWICPGWQLFADCNPTIVRPYINLNMNITLLKTWFTYDVLQAVKVNVFVNNIKFTSVFGFFVVYSQKNLKNYLNFTITNTTVPAYNVIGKYKLIWANTIDFGALTNDIIIKWTINSTDITPLNGNNLPTFVYLPQNNSYGAYLLQCDITYRNGSAVQRVFSQTTILTINPPPIPGTFIVYPSSAYSVGSNIQLSAYGFVPNVNSTIQTINAYTYYYYYLNDFFEYIPIDTPMGSDNGYSVFFNNIPPTSSLKLRVIYDNTSFIELIQPVTIYSSVMDYVSNINKIYQLNSDDGLSSLALYANNFREQNFTDVVLVSNICLAFINKLDSMLTSCYLSGDNNLIKPIFLNIEKVGTILEAVTSQSYNNTVYLDTFTRIYATSLNITLLYSQGNIIFSDPKCNNFLRAYDNILLYAVQTSSISNSNSNDFNYINYVLQNSLLNIDLGLQKSIVLQAVQIYGTSINSNYIKSNITYMFNTNFADYYTTTTNNIHVVARPDIFSFNPNYQTSGTNSSVLIPLTIINNESNDFVIQVSHYGSYNLYVNETNLTSKTVKTALTQEMFTITLINLTTYTFNVTIPANATSRLLGSTGSTLNTTAYVPLVKNVTVKNFTVANPIGLSNIAFINFTLPAFFTNAIYNKTTCIMITANSAFGSNGEDICDTWFDMTNQIVQCACDTTGTFTVIYNPNYQYTRKPIQFPQLNASIKNPWGYGTLIVLSGIFIFSMLWAYWIDKKQLNDLNNASLKKEYYRNFREKMKSKTLSITEVSSGLLWRELLKHTNEFYSLAYYKDFYFLRVHRLLVLIVRVYVVIIFCFWKQSAQLSSTLARMVGQRDILVRDIRAHIYNWNGDWKTELLTNIYYAIPIGFIMIIFPRLSEWLFRYDEKLLRFNDNSRVIANLSNLYFSEQIKKCKSLGQEDLLHKNIVKLDGNIQMHIVRPKNFNNNQVLNIEEIKFKIDSKKFRAYINFHKIISSLLFDVRYKLFLNQKQDNLPEDLAPIHHQRIDGQVEKYENRMYQIRTDLHAASLEQAEGNAKHAQKHVEIYRDKHKLMKGLNAFLEGQDHDDKEMLHRYGHEDQINHVGIGIQPKSEINKKIVEEELKEVPSKLIVPTPIAIREMEQEIEREKQEILQMKLNRDEKEIKNAVFKNPSNAFIPFLVERDSGKYRLMLFKIVLLSLIIFGLVYLVALNITTVRNQGGNNKAIFLCILAGFSIAENYFIFHPFLCVVKTIILMKYGAFYPKMFKCSMKYFLFISMITDVDRAIFKELKECVKQNAHAEANILTSEIQTSKASEDDELNPELPNNQESLPSQKNSFRVDHTNLIELSNNEIMSKKNLTRSKIEEVKEPYEQEILIVNTQRKYSENDNSNKESSQPYLKVSINLPSANEQHIFDEVEEEIRFTDYGDNQPENINQNYGDNQQDDINKNKQNTNLIQ